MDPASRSRLTASLKMTSRIAARCSDRCKAYSCGTFHGWVILTSRRRRPDFYMARASIEVARHGYPRQYGAIARVLIETLATVIVIAVKAGALEVFHSGTLDSTKCITWSKAVLPPLGQYWGMLSNEFVHIGKTTQKSSPQSFIQKTMKR
jgi:hypothetical protein